MADIYKVTESWMGVWVHSGPGVSYSRVGVIYGKDNKEYTVTERQNTYWLKIDTNRWVCDRDANGMIVMTKTGTTSASVVQPETSGSAMEQVDEETFSYKPEDAPTIIAEEEFYENIEDTFNISNIRGIFGMPYQFMDIADQRLPGRSNRDTDDGDIGRKYAKEIVSNMPLLLMIPGKTAFMAGYNRDDQISILENFIKGAAGEDEELKTTILSNKFGKYYSLEPAYDEYFKYVNPMCRIAAIYMGIDNEVIDGKSLGTENWAESMNSNFQNLFNVYSHCTAWYCDSKTSIDDTWSNGTTESMISSKINSLSDYGRELNFLLGTAKFDKGSLLDKFVNIDGITKSMQETSDFIANTLGSVGVSGIFKSLTNSIQTVAQGGKVVFPEIWSDSSFTRDYDINLKLVSPDGDDLSIYLNIIVPILHLLGFVLPRESTSTHGYIAPFLVRAYYKGLFNVDLGLMTNLSITKGKEGAWTPNGIPTVVDVSFTIKDLYSDMYMSNMNGNALLNNIILLDYIGNLCGININEPDIHRGIEVYFMEAGVNKFLDTWRIKVSANLGQYITNKYLKIFGKF